MKRKAWIAAALVALAACGAPPREQSQQAVTASVEPAPPPPKPPAAWEIRLETHGGYTGAGKGWIEIGSDGTASSEDCKAAALRDESVEQAVLAAQPEKWVGCYRRASFSGMTDQFSYHLRYRVEREGEKPIAYEISWQDDSTGMRPADLSRMADTAWGAHKQLESRCTP
jgi:hypothetical protein